jgi:hypothetical protein
LVSPDKAFEGSGAVPIGRIAYCLLLPRGFEHTLVDPIHTILYLAFALTTAAWLATKAIDIEVDRQRMSLES